MLKIKVLYATRMGRQVVGQRPRLVKFAVENVQQYGDLLKHKQDLKGAMEYEGGKGFEGDAASAMEDAEGSEGAAAATKKGAREPGAVAGAKKGLGGSEATDEEKEIKIKFPVYVEPMLAADEYRSHKVLVLKKKELRAQGVQAVIQGTRVVVREGEGGEGRWVDAVAPGGRGGEQREETSKQT